MIRVARAALAGILLAVSGCQLGPAYRKPQAAWPAAWDNTLPGSQPGFPPPDWWTGFGSPELDVLMAQARTGNTDLAAAIERVRQADAQAEIAGAPRFPAVSAGSADGPIRDQNQTGRERHRIQYQGLLRASYELDFWGKNQAAYESARASADAVRYARDVVWLTTSSSVADTYFQYLATQDRIGEAERNLSRARHTLEDVTLEEHQGLVPHLAVLEQQAVVSAQAAVIPPLRQQKVVAQTTLALLVGQLPEALHLPPGSLLDLREPRIAAGQPSLLLARRPDVHQAEASLVAANADIRAARAAFFPSFSFDLSGGVSALTLAQGLAPPLGIYALLANVSQPIFEGGALRGRLTQARSHYQELLVGTYRHAVTCAYGDVETALAGVRAAQEEVAAQQRNAADSVASSTLARESLRSGTGTILTLLASQTADYAAEDALLQARLALLQTLVGLARALGGGWNG